MNFEDELKRVFDIDIWQLKPQFSQEKDIHAEVLDTEILDAVDIKTKVEGNIGITNELAYCNDIASDKVINLFIDKSFNLTFLKNIIDNLFYRSKVSAYYSSLEDSGSIDEKGALVIYQNNFISQEHRFLSVENKKHILAKLYQYADFKTY